MPLLVTDPVTILGALVFTVVGAYIYQGLTNPLRNIPGPWYTKFTTLPSTFYVMTAKHPAWTLTHPQPGPIVRISPYEADTSSIPAVKLVHNATMKSQPFLKSPFYSTLITDSDSVFNTIHPANHRKYKRLLSSPMSESGLKAFLPQIDAQVRLAMTKIREEDDGPRGVADVAKWFMFLSFDVIGELTFGESFGNLEHGRKNRSVDDFVSLGYVGGLRSMFPVISKISTVLPIPVFRDATEIQWRTFEYAERALEKHRKMVEKHHAESGGAVKTDPKPTVFSKLYNAEHEETWTQKEIRDNAQVFIVGGSDTTANSMIYLVWAVCQHPEIKQKLLKELSNLPEGWGYDELRDLPYLNCIVNETLRLHTALPCGLPRIVPPGGCELAGHFVTGGATVTTQAYSLHRDVEAFPDPYRFYPERWENTTQRMKDCIMPFGGGGRTCLGRHLARIELRLITARFFLNFPNAVVSHKEGMSDKDMEMALYFLMVPSGHRCLIQKEA
ncbi:cytochrome P450 [Pseudomassariella vexata]|uniref:Cytochrome P450 n=1 Tax=Pseudomassariella vexata TaxID=1141098 RepID=A0A1Y2E011_9PEZI|nr:cytochrome P450 [Pseudomassariella vexata]ORY64872.1 cytochrome P450 [Pseudomassariella vexata]